MYENDYSDWPAAFAILMAVAAAGAALIGTIPVVKFKRYAIRAWMLVPAVWVFSMYEYHVVIGKADSTLYMHFLVLIMMGTFSVIWALGALPSFAIVKTVQSKHRAAVQRKSHEAL